MTSRGLSIVSIGALLLVAYVSFLGGVEIAYLHVENESAYQAAVADVPTRFDILNHTQRAELRIGAGQGGALYLNTFDFLFTAQRRAMLSGLWFGYHYGRLAWWAAWAPLIVALEVVPLLALLKWRYWRRMGRRFRP